MNEAKRILVVDDEEDILVMTLFRIKNAGYQTIAARDGQEGFDKAKQEKPDLILLDYKLPHMNGDEVYEKIQQEEELKDIPVMFITASKENNELKKRLDELGVKDVLMKPYDPDELIAKVKELLGE